MLLATGSRFIKYILLCFYEFSLIWVVWLKQIPYVSGPGSPSLSSTSEEAANPLPAAGLLLHLNQNKNIMALNPHQLSQLVQQQQLMRQPQLRPQQ